MVRGTTKSGFEFVITDEAQDDYELLEALQKVDEGDTWLIMNVVELLLGKEQKASLKEHVRGENGRVSATRLVSEVLEIFKSCNEIKN